jgi:hypothetical protein
VTAVLPRTIRAIGTPELLRLEGEAADCGFSQRLSVDWLRRHVPEDAVHYLFPMFEHRLEHRPAVSPQWRCQLLLSVRTGEQLLSLLDVRPAAFEELPETLDAPAKSEIAARMDRASSVREWMGTRGRPPNG